MGEIKVKVNPCGQGDSIMLEWVDKGVSKIGLIDCNIANNNPNKVINYLKKNSYESIDFIAMTHPHSDHYSGIKQIIEYCVNQKPQMNISNFIHTCKVKVELYDSMKTYFKKIHKNSKITYKELTLTFAMVIKEWNKGKKNGIIKRLKVFNDSSTYKLNNTLELKCLSPSEEEFLEFEKIEYEKLENINFDPDKEARNNPAANYLSTIIALMNKKTDKCLAIFTSDSEEKTFERLLSSNFREELPIFEDSIPIIQIPHHGSDKNYHENFWEAINLNESQTFLSVGRNSYGHPNKNVVKYFEKESCGFSCTAISDLTFYHDDTIEIWTSEESSYINNDSGVMICYELDYDGNCNVKEL